MKKKNWMKGLALTALVLMAVSCNKMDFGGMQITEEVITQNAEEKLGITIADGQTWQMTQQVNAKVTVNLGLDNNYRVGIYDENPMNSVNAHYYDLKAVADKGTAVFNYITIPTGATEVFATVYDSENRCLVKRVSVEKNMSVYFGADEPNAAPQKSSWRAIPSAFVFPSAPESSEFATTAPECPRLDGYKSGNTFFIDAVSAASGNMLQPNTAQWDKPIDIYVIGNVTLIGNNPVYFPGNVHLYILPHAKLTFNCDYNFEQAGGIIYIADGGELEVNGVLGIGSNCKVYTAGTGALTANEIEVRNGATLYNQGTIDISTRTSGQLRLTNSHSVVVNDGDLKVKSLNTQGSSHFQNNGSTVVTDATQINSNDNTWVNNGSYKTGYFFFTATSQDVINNCNLVVDKDFWMNTADGSSCFKMDANASAVIKNFYGGGKYNGSNGGPFRIILGSNSLFKVTDTADMNATKDNYGIYGPESGNYAVFQAKTIKTQNTAQGYDVTYGGNLAVVCETHFDSETGYTSKSGADPVVNITGNASIYAGAKQPLVQIPTSLCNPGLTPPPASQIEGSYPVYCYAFEDTKVGDYDMNDVVIKAQETANGKINLKVVACGATLNLNIRLYPAGTRSANEVAHYGESPETLTYNGQDEVHLMLGAEAGAMVNTGSSATARPITIQIDKGNYDPAHLPLAIFSAAQGEIRLAGSGQAPYGVIIPEDWSWPRERICITQAYNEAGYRFADFAATVGTAEDWYKHPTNWVMNEGSLGY